MLRINKICKICKKDFNVKMYRKDSAKYCSKNCYDIRNGIPIQYNCLFCNKEFVYPPNRPRRYCSHKCANKGRSIHLLEPKHPNNFKRFWMRRGMIIQKCEKCGYDECKEILGIHHIDENRNNNKRENLLILCPNCHSLIHRKHIPH